MRKKITVRGYTTDYGVRLIRRGLCPDTITTFNHFAHGNPITITLGHQVEAPPEPEGERRTVYLIEGAWSALRANPEYFTCLSNTKTDLFSEKTTLILTPEPQPRPRFVARASAQGGWLVEDIENGWQRSYPANHPGGAQRAAKAERDRLNGMDERGEL